MDAKKFFKEKSVGYWLMAAALVCGILALIFYLTMNTNEFTPTLDTSVTVGLIIFLVLAVVSLIFELRIIKWITAAVSLYAFLMYIVFEVNYITNLFVSIDPTELYAGFVLELIFSLAAFVLSLISAVKMKSGYDKVEKEKKEAKA